MVEGVELLLLLVVDSVFGVGALSDDVEAGEGLDEPAVVGGEPLSLDVPLRLSVTYQPLPLNTIAGGVRRRRAVAEHWGQA